MNEYNDIIKRLQAVEDELVKLRKQRNYELNNLDEDNVPRLREYSKLISENGKAISLIEQEVSEVSSSVTILSQYVDESIVGLQELTGNIDNELKTVKTNLASVETKADDAAASAELAAQSVTELESEVNGKFTTVNSNIASVTATANANKSDITALAKSVSANTTSIAAVKATADSASASVSAIVSNVGANGSVTAASIVAKINAAGSSVQISADHISLKGKTIALTADSIDIASTYFNVTTSGAVSCSSISVSGVNSVIDISGNSATTAKSTVRYTGASYPYSYQIPQGFVAMGADSSGYSYPNSTTHNGYVNGYASSVEAGYAVLRLGCNMWYYAALYADTFNNQVTVGGQFTCYGLKSRAEQTEHYRDRLMYAFETPNPLYSDFGRATIAEDGICYIFLDPIFYECIDNTCDYYVFIQPEGEGQFTVTERASDHFKVQGTAGTSFAWMLVTAQKGYSATRNEEIVPPEPESENIPNTENVTYDALGDDILREFESQLG